MSDASRTKEVLAGLDWFFGCAFGFREGLIEKDQPWNPKNEKYAKRLAAVCEYVDKLTVEHPAVVALAECDVLFDEDAGFQIPNDEWADVIHCNTDDPAAWFEDWIGGLVKQAKSPEYREALEEAERRRLEELEDSWLDDEDEC